MRDRFDKQPELFLCDIETAEIPEKCRDAMVGLMAALLAIYSNKKYLNKVLSLLDKSLPKKKSTGPTGLSLWQIFVLAQCRLCLNISYDRLHYLVNHDQLLRHILGIRSSHHSNHITWEYQRIYDNVTLLSDEVIKKVNEVVVEFGHEVFKKKETEALRLKTDSYVVQSNVHFPTDYRLLWDSARKCLDMIKKLLKKNDDHQGWRKIKDWHNKMKSLSRALGKASSSGGKNKEERVKNATRSYLKKARSLYVKLEIERANIPLDDLTYLAIYTGLTHFMSLLIKHIDLVDRRLLQGEKIPHEEKLFSIFEQYTEWIAKGKLYPNVELGKKLSITTDQYNLIVDFEIMENKSDSQIVKPLLDRVIEKHKVEVWSFDKGYWHKDNKAYFKEKVSKVIMPKKGKCNQSEKEEQGEKIFKKYRNKHSAVESNINELEHRGLDRCPDRNYTHYKRYIALGILSYNLHKIGKEIIRQSKIRKLKQEQAAKKKAA